MLVHDDSVVISGLGECIMPILFYYFIMIANNNDCITLASLLIVRIAKVVLEKILIENSLRKSVV
jgi:hypothetical protein